MKTLSNSPPPFKTGEFDLIFYFYFSTDQNRYDYQLQYPQFKKMNNSSQTHPYIFKLTHTYKNKRIPLVCIP